MKIPNFTEVRTSTELSLARIVSEDSQPIDRYQCEFPKSSKDS